MSIKEILIHAKGYSLKRNFFLFLLAVSFASGLFFFGIYWGVEDAFYFFVDNHLVEDATEFERLYSEGEELSKHEPFILRNQRNLVVDASNLEVIPPFDPNKVPYVENFKFADKTYRFINTRTSQGFYLQYGVDISQGLEFLELLKYVLITGWFIFMGLLVIFYWLFVKNSLSGLEKAVKEVLDGVQVRTYKEIEPLVMELHSKMEALKRQSLHYRDLLMGLSHSLKTPLGRLYLKLDLLSRRHREVDFKEIREELESIERSSRAFLRLTKLEAQSYNPSFQMCNLKVLVENLLRLYPSEKLGAELKDVFTECDPELAMEVFDVLLDNAFRHGEGYVWFFLRDSELLVENLSSKPIETNILNEPEGKRVGGIGLYVAKKLCEVLRWRLEMEQKVEGEFYRIVFKVHFLKV